MLAQISKMSQESRRLRSRREFYDGQNETRVSHCLGLERDGRRTGQNVFVRQPRVVWEICGDVRLNEETEHIPSLGRTPPLSAALRVLGRFAL